MKAVYISQLPDSVYFHILGNLKVYLEKEGYTKEQVEEACKNVADEKIVNVLNYYGDFIK